MVFRSCIQSCDLLSRLARSKRSSGTSFSISVIIFWGRVVKIATLCLQKHNVRPCRKTRLQTSTTGWLAFGQQSDLNVFGIHLSVITVIMLLHYIIYNLICYNFVCLFIPISYHILSYPIISYHILSYLIIFVQLLRFTYDWLQLRRASVPSAALPVLLQLRGFQAPASLALEPQIPELGSVGLISNQHIPMVSTHRYT